MTPSKAAAASLRLARAVWLAIPVPRLWRVAIGKIMISAVNAGLLGFRAGGAPVVPLSAVVRGPLVLSGLMDMALGVGSGARSTALGLDAAGLSPVLHDIAPILELQIQRLTVSPAPPGGVWIAHCNPPELLRLLAALPATALQERYRIGFWAWELPRIPARWARAADRLNEVWAPSQFVADAIARSVDGRPRAPVIRIVPHPLPDLSNARPNRARFGLRSTAVVILVMFDMRSSRARKNPDAAVEAFIRAFPEPQADSLLLCKVIGRDASPNDWEALKRRFANRFDMILTDEMLSIEETVSLIASADIILSTHRAEGYGMVLAEAMALERCVIATGWSGNLDFMNAENSVLLPFKLVPVVDPQGIYPRGQSWADVDIAATATLLRDIVVDPARRKALGAQARTDILRHADGFARTLAEAPWLSKVAH